jgi:hypothetical protein
MRVTIVEGSAAGVRRRLGKGECTFGPLVIEIMNQRALTNKRMPCAVFIEPPRNLRYKVFTGFLEGVRVG